jgi:starch synthase (maltosyl-transferring)
MPVTGVGGWYSGGVIGRIVIDDVRPRTPTGRYPAKAVIGEAVTVGATVFKDGHDPLAARVRWRPVADTKWRHEPMRLVEPGLDRWEAVIEPADLGRHELVVEAWVASEAGSSPGDAAGEDTATAVGSDPAHRTVSDPHPLWVDRERALVGAWYELFPRSEGGLRGAVDRLDSVAAMGFDVVYLPPIHPIGHTARKGPNNTRSARPGDPGSPWAIGAEAGGHTAVHPDLGTIDDFDAFVAATDRLGMEVALDYALQCSPDHPWVHEHPEWFHRRPDGTIRYAENPPKKYEDIYPINFWPDAPGAREALWDACKHIVDFWIGHGVRAFRVDNPHTKPMAFWEWLLPAVQDDHPDVIFLAEAFTRPPVMAKLAEVGFSQSYTYFTWRTFKAELIEYLEELCHGPKADYMRPNFWPNTPDILSGPLRLGSRAAFELRLVLAATLVPSYGVYSGYELLENEPASEFNEEYLHSEKYEVKKRDWQRPGSLSPLVTRLNDIRRRHPAFAELRNLRFVPGSNDAILAYAKCAADGSDTGFRDTGFDDIVLMVVNLDPHRAHDDVLGLDLTALGLPLDAPFEAHDELSDATYVWSGPNPYVRLDPEVAPAHVLHLRPIP